VKQGDELLLLGESGGWYHVQAVDGWQGYLRKDLAEIEAPKPAPGAAGPQVQQPPAQAATGPAIDHTALDCLLAEQFSRLDARFGPDPARARVFFRADGAPHWYFVEMTSGPGGYEGTLPKPKATTKKIDYYVEAVDKAFVTSRTQEYGPVVVPHRMDCPSMKAMGLIAPAGKLVVGTAATGAPAIEPVLVFGLRGSGRGGSGRRSRGWKQPHRSSCRRRRSCSGRDRSRGQGWGLVFELHLGHGGSHGNLGGSLHGSIDLNHWVGRDNVPDQRDGHVHDHPDRRLPYGNG
jgi:hypothetical protein